MKKIFFICSENEQAVKNELINLGFAESVVNALEYGYYRIVDGQFISITKAEFIWEKSQGAIVISCGAGAGFATAVHANSQLNIKHYNDRNEEGKRTGHGYAMEDLANRKARAEGKTVDASVGKTHEKGGADARIDEEDIQYKCSCDAQKTSDKIEDRDGYPDQQISVNTELVKPLKKELKNRETQGRVPEGTADRVVDSGISIEKAKRVARPLTKDSLLFDAQTALPTLGIAFISTTAISLIWDSVDEGVNKTTFKRALKRGSLCGGAAFIGHILYNQIRRVLKTKNEYVSTDRG